MPDAPGNNLFYPLNMGGNDPTHFTGGLRVLLAERRPDVRLALRLALEELLRFEVDAEVTSLDELEEKLRCRCPELLLLDWGLAGRRAVRTLLKIRTTCPGIRIIVIDNSEESRQRALKAGADDFVSKGSLPKTLVEFLGVYGKKDRVETVSQEDELRGLVT
jgi:DNA-binding NarL/FixJ family response regulator